MPRIINILLIVLLLAQAGGMLLVYQAGLWQHQARRDSYVEHTRRSKIRLSLTQEQYVSYRADRDEIRIGDRMYDLLERHQEGNVWVVTAINDSDEEQILERIQLHDHRPGVNIVSRFFLDFIDLFFDLPTPTTLSFFCAQINASYAHFFVGILEGVSHPYAPPPWLQSC